MLGSRVMGVVAVGMLASALAIGGVSVVRSAGPTVSPGKALAVTPSMGRVVAVLHSASGDAIGGGRGDFTLDGPGQLGVGVPGAAFGFTMTPRGDTSNSWSFDFSASVLQVGVTYTVSSATGVRGGPTFEIRNRQQGCAQANGSFTIVSQSPQVVVTFSQFCGSDPTRTLAGTATFTYAANLTATPTVPPNERYNPQAGFGQVSVDMTSSSGDPLGGGQGEIQFAGPGQLTVDGDGMRFSVVRTDNPNEVWTFSFFSLTMEVGASNDDVAKWPNDKRFPAMAITRDVVTSSTNEVSCGAVSGQFTIEQQSPTVVIEFVHLCEKDPAKALRGTLTFTASGLLTPSPTVDPATVMKATSGRGRAHVELESALGDLVGGGQGAVVFDGSAVLTVEPGHVGVVVASTGRSGWTFDFMAMPVRLNVAYTNVRFKGVRVGDFVFPGMQVMSPAYNVYCPNSDGTFKVDQQVPTVVIEFVYRCAGPAGATLKGTVTFTPIGLLTPTPTVDPANLYVPKAGPGALVVEMVADEGNGLVRNGPVRLSGNGSATIKSGSVEFMVDVGTGVGNNQVWSFTFYAPGGFVIGQKYTGATHYPANDKTFPGMQVEAPGVGCGELTGEFTVETATPSVVIDFTQTCNGSTGALHGTMTFTPTSTN